MSKRNSLSPAQYVALVASGAIAGGLATVGTATTPAAARIKGGPANAQSAASSEPTNVTVFLVRDHDDPATEKLANDVLTNLINGQGPDSGYKFNDQLQILPDYTPSNPDANDIERISDIDELIQKWANDNGIDGKLIVLSDTLIPDPSIQIDSVASPNLLGENKLGLDFGYANVKLIKGDDGKGDAVKIAKFINTGLDRMGLGAATVVIDDQIVQKTIT
jgi:hypothetical protein